jgi:hypothetical protein
MPVSLTSESAVKLLSSAVLIEVTDASISEGRLVLSGLASRPPPAAGNWDRIRPSRPTAEVKSHPRRKVKDSSFRTATEVKESGQKKFGRFHGVGFATGHGGAMGEVGAVAPCEGKVGVVATGVKPLNSGHDKL